MLTVRAPAKINLTLEVLGKREDGYHEIRSVIQAVSLCDVLRFEPAHGLEFRSDSEEWVAGQSLVVKAAALLRNAAGTGKGATVIVEKRIPLVAGLGGDSSDAAGTLRGLNHLWELGLPREELHGLAAQLGSDVPFFLYGGTALASGRGETIVPLPAAPRLWAVIIVPPVQRLPGKTGRLYGSLTPAHYSSGQMTDRLAHALRTGEGFDPSSVFNVFENVVFGPGSEMDVYRHHILQAGADNVHLAGSGPALFTLVENRAKADDLCDRLTGRGMLLYVAETTPCDGTRTTLRISFNKNATLSGQ